MGFFGKSKKWLNDRDIKVGNPFKSILGGVLGGKTVKESAKDYAGDVLERNAIRERLLDRADSLLARFDQAMDRIIKPADLEQDLLAFRALVEQVADSEVSERVNGSIDEILKTVRRGEYFFALGKLMLKNLRSDIGRMGV
jgi:hypothetical protein